MSDDMQTIDIPVVIVGGGSCGLTLSCILSDQKVDHVLFEKHNSTSHLPKAHYINQRTMEIFRQHGIADAVYKQASPIDNMSQVIWQSSLGGNGPHDQRVIGRLECFGGYKGSALREIYEKDSPTMSCNLPLLRCEPILKEIAEKRNPGKVFFGFNVEDILTTRDSVLVTVKTPENSTVHYRAAYVVGADGGKIVGPKMGVLMEGQTRLDDKVSVHFKANLSDYWDDKTLINHFINPEGGTITYSGALVVTGPTWGRFSEEWTMHFGHRLDDPERFNEANLVPRLRTLLKLPDLELQVLHISHWIQERVLANKYQQERLFIAGDAAHKHPPTTGLGLNTAVGDAHNLGWKLALVVRGEADACILETYESERRPVGRRNCDWAALTSANRAVLNAAIGLVPGQVESNKARFDVLFEDSDLGETSRAQVERIISSQAIEFSAHDIEIGYFYPTIPGLGDGTNPPARDPLGQNYFPTTRPGHRLPHAWLQKEEEQSSTLDLVGSEACFCLITDEYGVDWIDAARKLLTKRRNIHIAQISTGTSIAVTAAGYKDINGSWSKLREIKNGGAIVVRPDNHVAWRSVSPSQRKGGELLDAFRLILGGV